VASWGRYFEEVHELAQAKGAGIAAKMPAQWCYQSLRAQSGQM